MTIREDFTLYITRAFLQGHSRTLLASINRVLPCSSEVKGANEGVMGAQRTGYVPVWIVGAESG